MPQTKKLRTNINTDIQKYQFFFSVASCKFVMTYQNIGISNSHVK